MGKHKAGRPAGALFANGKRNRGEEALRQGRVDEAISLLQAACAGNPRDFKAWFLLGAAHGQRGDHGEATSCLRRALGLQPSSVPALRNLAVALQNLGQWQELAECRENLDRLDPGDLDNLAGLASLHQYIQFQLQAAVDGYQKVLRRRPGATVFLDNLASAYAAQGRIAEAVATHEQVLTRHPGNRDYHSNFLLTLHYDPGQTAASLFQAHRLWGERHGGAWPSASVFANAPVPERRLRVGYVSADFRIHPVASFVSPVLAEHNRQNFEIFCYSSVNAPDEGTSRIRSLSDQWRDISTMDDQSTALLIRQDQIDILVDLAGHTGGNRLGVFQRKPAPVQITYLGYPDTTGLPAMDYRITDQVADPPGQEGLYTEKLLHLPGCFLCYTPSPSTPEPGPLPAAANGHLTFGSLNNMAKINEQVVALWSDLLRTVAGSRLLVKNPSLTDLPTRARFLELFQANGIAPERLDLLGFVREDAGHLAVYNRIDIALDTFPYNGTTTTCEALWMGVPVISLTGSTHASRVGCSLLTALGFPGWVARTPAEYMSLALKLCSEREQLSGLRSTLRDRMLASSIMDAKAFVHGLEGAYREAWRRWCAGREQGKG